MEDSSDEDLVARTCAGTTSAYGVLVSRYENSARVVAFKYVNDHHLAEDIVQQAFVRGFEKLETLRDRSQFGSWLMRIVRREACNCVTRARERTVQWSPACEPELDSDRDRLSDDLAEVIQLLNRLPEHERVVMSLHYIDGHPVAAIARMTGRPVGTVTKQLSRATKRIQSLVRKKESQHEH